MPFFGWSGHRAAQGAEKPLRDELLSIERLEERAKSLAARFTVDPSPRRLSRSVFPRFRDNARVLNRAYRTLAQDVHRGEFVTPAGEWLLDNFHLVASELLDVRRNLPRGYYRQLPKLALRELAGNARVYALAVELIRHSDSRLERHQLVRFLNSYQTVAPLTIGELWAWPSMLKLALIENLRRLAEEVLQARGARQAADAYVARFDAPGQAAIPELSAALPTAYLVRLLERVREYGLRLSPVRAVVEDHLAAQHLTSEDAIRREHQHQAAAQVSVANVITSLRLCATLDWSHHFEAVSLVERVLQRDPAGAYGSMDFLSRDRYRQAVEELADPTGEAQLRVGLRAVESARQAAEATSPADRAAHVGHHLIGLGRRDLEIDVAYRPEVRTRLRQFVFAHATAAYFASIGLVIALLILMGVAYVRGVGTPAGGQVWVAFLLLLPASELAIAVVQRLAARLAPPRRLPRLDLQAGIPEQARTMVVVPTLLTSVPQVEELIEHLAVVALGNLDARVHFAILSDFTDALAQQMPGDEAILSAARAGVESLNARYAEGRTDRFFLFHRERRWNAQEETWMGWERKRGKIEEFNRLLRGATDTTFEVQVGDVSILPSVRYCITLDTDTRLPRDAAKKLVGIIAHPLNCPHFDAAVGRVTEGYGILQPRVSVTMASAAGSRFARLYAGHTGVDPYTTAVSDTYQDLFGEGIFTGKGLYDVDAFMAAMEGRVPDNALLSHDLFEGLHARTALVTDVEVVDDYPSSVLAHARRQHRWVRGDWQILFWLLPFVPTRSGLQRNRLPLISRWKIFDNLRRSLLAPATLALLVLAWTTLPGSADGVDGGGARRPGLSAVSARPRGPGRAQDTTTGARVPARGMGGRQDRRGPVRSAPDLPRQPGVPDGSRHRAHARPAGGHAPPPAPVGIGGGERGPVRHPGQARGHPHFRRGDGRQPGHRLGCLGAGGARTARLTPRCRSSAGAVGGRALRRLQPQPRRDTPASRTDPRGSTLPARHRAHDVALLRHLHGAGGPRPAARQRSGGAGTQGGAPDLADQHRHGTARHAGGTRFRLHPHRRTVAAGGRHPDQHRRARALRRPPAQLVRHDEPGTAAAPLRVHGGQRQPGGRAADPGRGAAASEPERADSGDLVRRGPRASPHARPRLPTR